MKTTIGIMTLVNLLAIPLQIFFAIDTGYAAFFLPIPINVIAVYLNRKELQALFKKETNETHVR